MDCLLKNSVMGKPTRDDSLFGESSSTLRVDMPPGFQLEWHGPCYSSAFMGLEVSVVVPLRNEHRTIARLLRSLERQTLLPREIVCVDGGSTDGTVEVINRQSWGPVPVRVVEAGPSYPGRGRNVGTREARHDWVAYIDGGIEAERDWLAELVSRVHQDPEVDVVFGNFAPRMDDFFSECAASAYVKPPCLKQGERYRGPTIASVLMKRSTWERLGGFPEHLRSGEDLLFIDKALRSARFAYAPRARVSWELAPTCRATYQRFRAYANSGIEAGTFRDWHLRMLSRYAAIALTSSSSWFIGVHGLLIPIPSLLGFLILRAARSVWRYREELPRFIPAYLSRVLGTTVVLAAVDLGLIVGTFDWLRGRAAREPHRSFNRRTSESPPAP